MPEETTSSEQNSAKRIFISYSQTDAEYMDWVRELATRMQADGFDVRLDQWYLREGDDVFAYMESMVTDTEVAKIVILVDPRYAQRADSRQGGIGVESTIISQELYGQVEKTKFIPVIARRDEHGRTVLPVFLKSRYYIDLSDQDLFEEKYVQLLRAIDNKPLHEPPPVGKRPSFLDEKAAPVSPATFKKRAAHNAISEHKPTARGHVADYLDALKLAIGELTIADNEAKNAGELESLWWERLDRWTPLRDEFIDLMVHLARFGHGIDPFTSLPSFFESLLPYTQDAGAVIETTTWSLLCTRLFCIVLRFW